MRIQRFRLCFGCGTWPQTGRRPDNETTAGIEGQGQYRQSMLHWSWQFDFAGSHAGRALYRWDAIGGDSEFSRVLVAGG